MIRELILKNRSYRKFKQYEYPSTTCLHELIDLARLSPCAANLQSLKYLVSNKLQTNEIIFNNLTWAGYLRDWPGPAEGEKPSAYIVILGDRSISKNFSVNHGIAAQSILLGAVELGLGGCILGSINRERLHLDLKLASIFEILLVIALGIPTEKIVIDEINQWSSIKYWRDDQGTHHVPKRRLNDIIL